MYRRNLNKTCDHMAQMNAQLQHLELSAAEDKAAAASRQATIEAATAAALSKMQAQSEEHSARMKRECDNKVQLLQVEMHAVASEVLQVIGLACHDGPRARFPHLLA